MGNKENGTPCADTVKNVEKCPRCQQPVPYEDIVSYEGEKMCAADMFVHGDPHDKDWR